MLNTDKNNANEYVLDYIKHTSKRKVNILSNSGWSVPSTGGFKIEHRVEQKSTIRLVNIEFSLKSWTNASDMHLVSSLARVSSGA